MPEAAYWETLFDTELIVSRMQIDSAVRTVVEIGCGYGTFTIPAARSVRGSVHTYDIEPEMVNATTERARSAGIHNIQASARDVIESGIPLPAGSVDYVMLFNILHHEKPGEILSAAKEILCVGGRVGCVHWNYDPATPRGPTMDIRPRPDELRRWMEDAGFEVTGSRIDLPPYHYGWLGRKE